MQYIQHTVIQSVTNGVAVWHAKINNRNKPLATETDFLRINFLKTLLNRVHSKIIVRAIMNVQSSFMETKCRNAN